MDLQCDYDRDEYYNEVLNNIKPHIKELVAFGFSRFKLFTDVMNLFTIIYNEQDAQHDITHELEDIF